MALSAHQQHEAHVNHMKQPGALEQQLRQNYPELIPYLEIPELKTVLLKGIQQNWSDTNFRAALYGTKWWQTHNAQEKQWLISTPADRLIIEENAKEQVAKEYTNLWGMDIDPTKIDKSTADRIAQGRLTVQQWVAQQRNSQTYKDRYPGLIALHQAGDFTMNEAQYRQLENNYKQTFHQYGIDATQFDQPGDFTNLFKNQIDPTELGARLKDYRWVTQVGGQFVRDAFAKYAGINNLSDSDLYGIMSGQRPDLVKHYNTQTGKQVQGVDLNTIEQSVQKAQDLNKAEFNTGGAVSNAPAAQPEKLPQQMQEAF